MVVSTAPCRREGEGGQPRPTLYMRGITKVFPGVIALKRVDFELRRGEIHGLLGENGAGKTTLMKILCGIYSPDEGEVYIDGRRVEITSPRDAFRHGIVMVNQYPRLVDELTVAENIALSLSGLSPLSRVSRVRGEIERIAERYGFSIDPDAPAWRLSFSERQRVEIIKALILNARILIFDEPTTLLTGRERRALYDFMRKAAGEGRSVVLITHKLSEALEVTDRITVLRRGEVKATLETRRTSYSELIALMFGGRLEKAVTEASRKRSGDGVALVVRNLYVTNDLGVVAVRGASFEVRKGEVLGIAGIAGNGQVELAEAIAGIRRPLRGEVRVNGVDIFRAEASVRRRLVGYVPDRVTQAVVLDMPIYENVLLRLLDRYQHGMWGIIDYPGVKDLSMKLIERFKIYAGSPEVSAGHLSGGNLQKLVLAREIASEPSLMVIVNPARALDHVSSELVYSAIEEYRGRGGAVLLISEDLEEIYRLSDRVGVIHDGVVTILGDRSSVTVEEVEECMAGGGGG